MVLGVLAEAPRHLHNSREVLEGTHQTPEASHSIQPQAPVLDEGQGRHLAGSPRAIPQVGFIRTCV